MQISPGSTSVADYCQAMGRGEILVNKQYQRSDKVWPEAAKSFLIETILRGYPMPKFFLYQVTDLRSRRTLKEIVDGQQRSQALCDFYSGKYSLSRSLEMLEAAGRTYDELDDELKERFLGYTLSFDLISASTPAQVTEVFRRLNLYTIPLNPEEQRHAVNQGPFKWFVHNLTEHYAEGFLQIGLFTQKQLVRMSDTKLVAELIHAIFYGIKTTSKSTLDKLYKEKDKNFTEEPSLRSALSNCFDKLLEWNEIHQTSLMKPHQVYALALAILHIQKPMPSLLPHFKVDNRQQQPNLTRIMTNLTALAESVDNESHDERFNEFVKASEERTNVASQRATRFRWYCRALTEETI